VQSPARLLPSALFITMVGHGRGMVCVGVLGTRERGAAKKGEKTFLPCYNAR